MVVASRFFRGLDNPDRKKELMSYCLHPLCSPFLYTHEEFRAQKKNPKQENEVICFKCKEPGHISTNCSSEGGNRNSTNFQKNKKGERSKSSTSREPSSTAANTCFNCGQDGHYASSCNKPKKGAYTSGNENRSLYCYRCK